MATRSRRRSDAPRARAGRAVPNGDAAPPDTGREIRHDSLGRRLPRGIYTALEARALLEIGALAVALPCLRSAPTGDGHPVLLLPGFAAGDASMEPLRLFLKSRNYAVESWGFGRNPGYNRKFAQVVEQKIRYLHHKHGRKISLVGWSLGGVFSFYAAHVVPECVRSVISLGSPLRIDPDAPPPAAARVFYQALSANPLGPSTHAARARAKVTRGPPPVPSTCIFTEGDGLVSPEQATLDGDPETHENICVVGSHLGLGVNPLVLWLVADRLAQPEGGWRPYRFTGALAPLLRMLVATTGGVSEASRRAAAA